MKNWKKTAAGSLTAGIIFALAGCSGTANIEETKAAGAAPAGTAGTEVSGQAESVQEENVQAAEIEKLDYPKSTITIVVPYGAGGAMDNTARLFAKYAEKLCGQTIIISNISGGSGSVGAADVLSSKADGYKMLIFDPGPGFVNTSVNPVPFDTMEEFVMVGRQTADVRNIVVRKADERFPNPEAFIQYVKDHPGEVNVSTAGATTDAGITIELLNRAGKMEMVNVPFSGAAEAKAALLGGHVDAASISVGDSIAMLRDEQIMVVGVCSIKRSDILPDAPTFAELGLDVSWSTSRGYAFKAGTDERIVAYFEDVLRQVSEDPEYQKELLNLGCPAEFMGSEAYTEFVAENFEIIREILK